MTSLLKSFKQVPVNAGYFVCIKATTDALLAVDASGNPTATGPATPTIADQYIDLGVTRILSGKVYRKVVIVSSPLNVAGVERFIEIGGATSAFARMG
jgi:hypothetical protein